MLESPEQRGSGFNFVGAEYEPESSIGCNNSTNASLSGGKYWKSKVYTALGLRVELGLDLGWTWKAGLTMMRGTGMGIKWYIKYVLIFLSSHDPCWKSEWI